MATISTQSDPSFGRRIGKYTVLASLGEGGMANVFLASTHGPAGFTKLVVIKVLRTSLARADDLVEMFLNEARLAARLNHPNVVQTNEVAAEDGAYYMTMEYLEGQALHSIIQRSTKTNSPFPLPHYLRILADALAGLEYAHNAKNFDGTDLHVVHRDVSPHNVFVTYDGIVKVLDFGIAKATGATVHTETGVLRGKIAYMAPEQIAGVADLDRRADIFSMGVMLWEVLTGKRFRTGRTDLAILSAAMNDVAPSPREQNPDVDPELERICLKALARERDDRYATAAQMQSELETALERFGPPRTTSREVGAYVAEMFKEDRAQMRGAIEAQMANPNQSIPHVRADGAKPTFTPSGSDGGKVEASGSRIVAAEPAAAPSRAPWAIAALVALLIGLVAALLLRGPHDRTAASPAAPPSPASSPTTAPPPAAKPTSAPIVVAIRATPANARIYIDGVPVDDNPHVSRVPPDGTRHAVRAEASGYVTHEESVVFDHDATISLELARETTAHGGGWRPTPRPAPPPRSTQAASQPAPTPAAPATPAPTSTGEPRIDMENPYAK